MRRILTEKLAGPRQGLNVGMELGPHLEAATVLTKGEVIIEMIDSVTGETLESRTVPNIITLDAGILAARLFANSLSPNPAQNNGITMLAVGTGATGNVLSPDAPTATQRRLNTEIARKACTAQFRNDDGIAVAYPTHIVDFTTTFGNGEAVGALNEMGLISAYSTNPLVLNQINNGTGSGTPTYDSTINVSAKDLMANYLTFSVISKPNLAVLRLTWRFTF